MYLNLPLVSSKVFRGEEESEAWAPPWICPCFIDSLTAKDSLKMTNSYRFWSSISHILFWWMNPIKNE